MKTITVHETTPRRDTAAMDALAKIQALLGAAQFLTYNDEEQAVMFELLSIAEEVAIRGMGGKHE